MATSWHIDNTFLTIWFHNKFLFSSDNVLILCNHYFLILCKHIWIILLVTINCKMLTITNVRSLLYYTCLPCTMCALYWAVIGGPSSMQIIWYLIWQHVLVYAVLQPTAPEFGKSRLLWVKEVCHIHTFLFVHVFSLLFIICSLRPSFTVHILLYMCSLCSSSPVHTSFPSFVKVSVHCVHFVF